MNPQDATELGLKAGARSKRRHKNLWGRSAIAQRHWRAVSICSDEKRPLSDARREIERRAEGSLLLANVRAAKNGVAVIIELLPPNEPPAAGCATSISCAGHASVAHATKPKLTSYPDHSVGADQCAMIAPAMPPATWAIR